MSLNRIFWLRGAEIRDLDRRAVQEYGLPSIVLMENAGRGCAEWLRELNPQKIPVTILCGKGNNGGDGMVIARHAQLLGMVVEVWLFARSESELSPDAATQFRIIRKAGIPVHMAFQREFVPPNHCWVVDALFGTGLDRSLQSPYPQIIQTVNQSQQQVLAVDIPSGLNSDNGEVLGAAIQAHFTATMVCLKPAFLNPLAKKYIGEVRIIDIGVPSRLLKEFRSLRLPV